MSDRDPGRPVTREEVIFRSIGQEWVVYDPARRQLHVLNATAALIWSLCDGEHDAPAIADVLADTLEESPDRTTLVHEVEKVLRGFATEELLA